MNNVNTEMEAAGARRVEEGRLTRPGLRGPRAALLPHIRGKSRPRRRLIEAAQ